MKTIVVHSFMRDSHKSVIAAHLAMHLAAEGYRVGVVEADMLMPEIHRTLQCDTAGYERTFNDFILGHASLIDAALEIDERRSLAGAGTLMFVPASTDPADRGDFLQTRVDMTKLASGFTDLGNHFGLEYLVVNGPAGLDEISLSCLALADTLVIALRLHEEDTHGTSVTVDLAQRLNIPHVSLVVNRVDDEFEPEVVRQEVEAAFGTPTPLVLTVTDESMLALADRFSLQQRSTNPLAPLLHAIHAEKEHTSDR